MCPSNRTLARYRKYAEQKKRQEELLDIAARRISRYAVQGKLDGFVYNQIETINYLAGPHVGTLLVRVLPPDAKRLSATLTAQDAATLRGLLWDFPLGTLDIRWAGQSLQIQAGWPVGYEQELLLLSDYGPYPTEAGTWHVGITGDGALATLRLNSVTPHILIAGMTGMGKSEAAVNAVLQMAARPRHSLESIGHEKGDPGCWFILIAPKGAEGFWRIKDIAGRIGPMAIKRQDIRSALLWAVAEMNRRNSLSPEKTGRLPRIVVVIDEVQIAAKDEDSASLIERIALEGRTAKIYMVLIAHHPKLAAFGGTDARRDLPMRLVFKMGDDVASRTACGGSYPPAHKLRPHEAWAINPGDPAHGQIRRVAAFKVSDKQVENAVLGEPLMKQWPRTALEDVSPSAIRISIEPRVAAALTLSKLMGLGRGKTRSFLAAPPCETEIRSNETLDTLRRWASDLLVALEEYGFGVKNLEEGQ